MLAYGAELAHFCGCRYILVLSVVWGLIIIIIITKFYVVRSMVGRPLANIFTRPKRHIGLSIVNVSLPVCFQYLVVILLASIVSVFHLVRGRHFPVILLIADISLLVQYARRPDFVPVSSDQVDVSYLKVKEQRTGLQILKPRRLLVFITAPGLFFSQLIRELIRGRRIAHGDDLIIAGV